MESSLTLIEASRLAELERDIETFRVAFIPAGRALRAIRDSKLYRPHLTFKDYCDQKWGLPEQHAYRLIDAVDCFEVLKNSPIGEFLPANESQCRELTKLEDPERQVAAWTRVEARVSGNVKKVTAAMVREEVAKFLPEKEDEFVPDEEAEAIRKFLAGRLKKWPEFYRPTFGSVVSTIVADLAADLELEVALAND